MKSRSLHMLADARAFPPDGPTHHIAALRLKPFWPLARAPRRGGPRARRAAGPWPAMAEEEGALDYSEDESEFQVRCVANERARSLQQGARMLYDPHASRAHDRCSGSRDVYGSCAYQAPRWNERVLACRHTPSRRPTAPLQRGLTAMEEWRISLMHHSSCKCQLHLFAFKHFCHLGCYGAVVWGLNHS